jgi:3-hydroxyacyl-CoA dehydrogenase/enoyl-CoA hydratase/3-hydroxybutyryl-CoA epimerase/enoyl-CoA isomerase
VHGAGALPRGRHRRLSAEADLALLYGIGFPPFRGGIFRWMDTVGLAHIAEQSEKFAHLGKAYELTDGMRAKLAAGEDLLLSALRGE